MNDALLKPYLDATGKATDATPGFASAGEDPKAMHCLQTLYESHLQSIVRPILWSLLKKQPGPHDREDEVVDLEADVIAVLFPRLGKVHSHPIPNLSGYAARVAYHCAYRSLGKKFPLRASAQNSLKVILRNTKGFALWEENNRALCGFAQWQEENKSTLHCERLTRALADPAEFSLQAFPTDDPHHLAPPRLLNQVFNWFGHPLFFSDAVTLFLALRGVIDERSLSLEEANERGMEPAAPGADPMRLLQSQAAIHRIWERICCLSPKQRAALLLDWKEIPESPVQIFLLQGALSFDTIAAALELTPRRLSEMLLSLPWEDAQIAAQLQTTDKVIRNLRSSASKKLREQLGSDE